MPIRKLALAGLCLFALAADATAETVSPQARDESVEANAEAAPVPLRWVPGWLMTSISKAIADATDTSDRAAKTL